MKYRQRSDAVLEVGLLRAVRDERASTLSVLRHLAEFQRRKLFADAGYPSAFLYCTKKLGYSEAQAYLRIHAANALLRHPIALRFLARGRVSMASLSRLAPHLTPENRIDLLGWACGRSKLEVERRVAGLAPQPEKNDVVRRKNPAPSPARIIPAAATRFRVSFDAGERFVERLDRLKSVLWHKAPRGGLEAVLLEAVEFYLERKDPLAGPEPRRTAPTRRPAPVRRGALRDAQGRCEFRAPDGTRCPATAGLQLDHITPRARGGSDARSNLRVLCAAHNRLAARRLGLPGSP